MSRKWLIARRDGWVDAALAYTVVPVLLLALLVVAVLPPTTTALLVGMCFLLQKKMMNANVPLRGEALLCKKNGDQVTTK